MEPNGIIVRLHVTEKSLMLAERYNVITFVVTRTASKLQIKRAVEKLYGVKVAKVNTMIAPTGEKKAFVKLSEGYNAIDMLSRLGVL